MIRSKGWDEEEFTEIVSILASQKIYLVPACRGYMGRPIKFTVMFFNGKIINLDSITPSPLILAGEPSSDGCLIVKLRISLQEIDYLYKNPQLKKLRVKPEAINRIIAAGLN